MERRMTREELKAQREELLRILENYIYKPERLKRLRELGKDFKEETIEEIDPAKLWETVNEIMKYEGYMEANFLHYQFLLKQRYQNVTVEAMLDREKTDAELMTDDVRMDILKNRNYVEEIKESGRAFNLNECFRNDACARFLIEAMSTPEKKREALSIAHIFDTTRQDIEKALETEKDSANASKNVTTKDIADDSKDVTTKDIADASKDLTSEDIRRGKGFFDKIRKFFKVR